jgi:NAD(P)-dependent dehydrogenase (short-subunit alcohol dehydrogenase family)
MKTILVTGSTDGIGKQTTLEVAKNRRAVKSAPVTYDRSARESLWKGSLAYVKPYFPLPEAQ